MINENLDKEIRELFGVLHRIVCGNCGEILDKVCDYEIAVIGKKYFIAIICMDCGVVTFIDSSHISDNELRQAIDL